MSQGQHPYLATVPGGLESLLARELASLGALEVRARAAGVVGFRATTEVAARVCLWSRLANRLLLPLTDLPAGTPTELGTGVRAIRWERFLRPQGTLAVDFHGTNGAFRHTRFGAQTVKDAVVDRFRDRCGVRPSVRLDSPDLRISVRLLGQRAKIGIDLSGRSLHRRGYRLDGGTAPLKENLAAGILMLAGWPEALAAEAPFVDPMCGSGTLLVEAAWLATDRAPGLGRDPGGLGALPGFSPALWEKLQREARDRNLAATLSKHRFLGFDNHPGTVAMARENILKAGCAEVITIDCRPLASLSPPPGDGTGLLAVNPPYGERIGEAAHLGKLYRTLGKKLGEEFTGWRTAILTANASLRQTIGLRSLQHFSLFNGAIPCQLDLFGPEGN
ncbi:MAG: hypothetical protein HQL59_00095 [Magnetococcales bacterium]|nr:hypothetical protein [Magnetococcales bacterium]